VAFYTVFGFLILPLIGRSILAGQLARQLGREVSITKVRVNPYVLSASIQGFVIKEKEGGPFVSWDEVYANVQLSSLFGRDWVFREIRVRNPDVRIQVNPDRRLNFADILDRFAQKSTEPKPAKPSKPIGLRIDQFDISGATLGLADLTPKRPFRKTVGPLQLSLKKFATDPSNQNPYSFEGSTEAGERFTWSGHFFLDPIRSQGKFSIENISLEKYASLYEELVRFEVRDGVVGLQASYDFEQSERTNIARVSGASFSLHSLKVGEAGAAENVLEVPGFEIKGASGDLFGRTASVDSITSDGGRLAMRRNKDASLNLAELSRAGANATNTAGGVVLLLRSVSQFFELVRRSTNAWTGLVRAIDLQDYAVRMEDLSLSRPVRANLDQIAFNVRDLSNQPGSNVAAGLSFRWNTNGTFDAKAIVSIFPAGSEIEMKVRNLDVRGLDPYLDDKLNLLITQGDLSLDGVLKLAREGGVITNLSFRGGLQLDGFATVDGALNEDLIKWKSLGISGIEMTLNPLAVGVKEVSLEEPFVQFVLNTNGTSNLSEVLRKEPSTTNTAVAVMPATNSTAVAAAGGPKLMIDSVKLSNAHLGFLDRSIEPNVRVSLQQLSGEVAGLSSEEPKRADVTFKGKVDNTAPIEISARINPLKAGETNELKAVFKSIELSPFGPYVGKYVGYRLNKGRLSLDVDYQLDGENLQAKNLINFDQLTLGAKTSSPDATKMPVKLAVAILKDRSGKIELDVPVEGNLKDPEFRLGKVIVGAIGNIITKLITSPFAALGSLFGGKGEEMSYVDFKPGLSELAPADLEKLDSLLKGLYERPELGLEIAGSFDPETDGPALKKERLDKELRARKWAALRKSEQSSVTPDKVTLSDSERGELLRKAYEEFLKANSASPTESKEKPTVQELERLMLAKIEISEGDLRLLAEERAKHVKEKILGAGKVEAERVFMAESTAESADKPASRVYFHLQ